MDQEDTSIVGFLSKDVYGQLVRINEKHELNLDRALQNIAKWSPERDAKGHALPISDNDIACLTKEVRTIQDALGKKCLELKKASNDLCHPDTFKAISAAVKATGRTPDDLITNFNRRPVRVRQQFPTDTQEKLRTPQLRQQMRTLIVPFFEIRGASRSLREETIAALGVDVVRVNVTECQANGARLEVRSEACVTPTPPAVHEPIKIRRRTGIHHVPLPVIQAPGTSPRYIQNGHHTVEEGTRMWEGM